MIVYAAIDLRRGRVVQLVGGRPDRERVSLADPLAVVERWRSAGFAALHVVDLDAALGNGDNAGALESILEAAAIPVQVGGGVRSRKDIERWLSAGATRVIVGTRAVTDRPWLHEATGAYPDRIVVAADVRGDTIVTHGWTNDTGVDLAGFVADSASLPLAGLLVTDVGREGRLEGIDADLFLNLSAAAAHPVIAAGGITTVDDIRALAAAGCDGAVVGTALYTGAIDACAVAQEFSQ